MDTVRRWIVDLPVPNSKVPVSAPPGFPYWITDDGDDNRKSRAIMTHVTLKKRKRKKPNSLPLDYSFKVSFR
jgi:hypothetical protein